MTIYILIVKLLGVCFGSRCLTLSKLLFLGFALLKEHVHSLWEHSADYREGSALIKEIQRVLNSFVGSKAMAWHSVAFEEAFSEQKTRL